MGEYARCFYCGAWLTIFYAVSLFNYNVWSDELGVAVMCGGPFIAIFAGVAWWAFHVPRWRRWALAQGADPDKLQQAAEKARLVSKKGSFWEKLEFDVQDKVEG